MFITTMNDARYGIAVSLRNLICPHGKVQPMKAVAKKKRNSRISCVSVVTRAPLDHATYLFCCLAETRRVVADSLVDWQRQAALPVTSPGWACRK